MAATFIVQRGVEVRVLPAPRAPLSDTTKQETARRPGESRRIALNSTGEGREKVARARRELAAMLSHDSIAPLSALRLERGLSQSDLAHAAGMKQPQLSRLESGQHETVLLSTVQRLASALGVSLERVAAALDASKP